MNTVKTTLPFSGQLLYACGSTAFTLLERLILLYMPFYYLPPMEYGLPPLVSDRAFLGLVTVLGAALLVGRIFDGISDPIVASLSDNSRSRLGRRKLFLLAGAAPLACSAVLVFYPPHQGGASALNGLWLGLTMVTFYLFFTVYVNPFLALLPELGHTANLRINLSTMIALFGLAGLIVATILFPTLANNLQAGGLSLREAYRAGAAIFGLGSMVILFLAALGFDEKKHCLPAVSPQIGAWFSMRQTLKIKAFRIILGGEVFLQFAMNMVTLGLIYYAVVIFREDDSFMITIAGLTIGGALLCFPLVNILAKKVGKKKVITAGVFSLALSGMALFWLSFDMSGPARPAALAMFFTAGFPLAVLTTLINPTIADLARVDYFNTGRRREAMFFGARAIPLKLSIALAGVVFSFLLANFGRDVGQPLGIRLTLLAVSVAAAAGFLLFRLYPEKEVLDRLSLEEEL